MDGRREVFAAVGMFDGVHRGHEFVLGHVAYEARQCGAASIAITFSNHPLESIRPDNAPGRLTSNEYRSTLILQAGIGKVELLDFNKIRHMDGLCFLKFLKNSLGVTRLFMGFNNHIGCDRIDAAAAAKSGIITVVKLPEIPGENTSSSKVRQALINGDIPLATKLLGRNYSFRGTVEEGRKLGRTIGFPTANIKPDDSRQLYPADGVYAVDITLPNGKKQRGMANIGTRPTVDGHRRTIEANIFDFSGDLYSKKIEIEFLARLRNQERFGSLEQLAEQLAKDKKAALAL